MRLYSLPSISRMHAMVSAHDYTDAYRPNQVSLARW